MGLGKDVLVQGPVEQPSLDLQPLLPNRKQRRAISALMRRHAFLLTNAGKDMAALVLGGGALPGSDTNVSGFATATSATSLTNSGASWTTDRYKGHIVFAGPNNSGTGSAVWGVILTNSGTVLTVDRWYAAGTPSGSAGTTPNSTASYVIAMGGAAAPWIALTENSGSPAAGDTQLTGELVVCSSAGRSAEQRHDAIAHHMIDRALVAMDRLHNPLKHRIADRSRLLWIAIAE